MKKLLFLPPLLSFSFSFSMFVSPLKRGVRTVSRRNTHASWPPLKHNVSPAVTCDKNGNKVLYTPEEQICDVVGGTYNEAAQKRLENMFMLDMDELNCALEEMQKKEDEDIDHDEDIDYSTQELADLRVDYTTNLRMIEHFTKVANVQKIMISVIAKGDQKLEQLKEIENQINSWPSPCADAFKRHCAEELQKKDNE